MQEDYFQARTTLESIVGNYAGDEAILKEAKTKLNELNALENESFDNPPEPKEEELYFDEIDTQKQNDDQFEEEQLEDETIPSPNTPKDDE